MIRRFLTLLKNRYFWAGAAGMGVVAALIYVVLNYLVMPTYTRHGDSVPVPDVMAESYEDASSRISEVGLRPEEIVLRKPNLPRGVVIDQNPKAGWPVKPGRRIYLTINSGDTTTVVVPDVESLSVREAQNRIMIRGLAVADVLPDSIPSLHANTITRQEPVAGKRVDPGAEVRLWFSTGLGQQSVLVPDVTGMRTDSARVYLLDMRLRSVLIGSSEEDNRAVVRQSPEPGTSVREGSEIRLWQAESGDEN